ncbi:radical SAM family heme chaperone HemW [Lutimaribacter marinistellae]|uniref:Heme chaperone HemW n=1 Tax=Lutimaribacter marinistellae TaxID=1820329 RepID=A0ABV7TDV4_9RHOB
MEDDWRNGGFGLYVHWPFCEAKCPYCDFNSHVTRTIDQARWAEAYELEIDRYANQTSGRVLNTIFFGGGTPSLMKPETVAKVIERARHHWPFANDIEITLEANPSSVEAGRFSAYREAGVNRVSLGVQALNDRDLRRLGRLHSVAEAKIAYDIARTAFDRVSFDLIYARQDQTLSDWKSELNEALSMAIDHLSLYQLTIEPGTAFGDRYKRGLLRGLPEDDTSADMYHATQEICSAHGLPAYEVSNHARPGAVSRHNLIYWRYGDYVGIGPGAHGRLTIGARKLATETYLAPGKWLDQVFKETGESARHHLSPQDMGYEHAVMGLRLSEGLSLSRHGSISGQEIPSVAIADLAGMGMLSQNGDRIRATDQGRAVLNAVLGRLLADS